MTSSPAIPPPPELLATLLRRSSTLAAWSKPRQKAIFQAIRRAQATTQQLPPTGDYFPRTQQHAAPGPLERGHRITARPAEVLLQNALPLADDPDIGVLWASVQAGDFESEVAGGFTYNDLPDLVGVPTHWPDGKPYAPGDRLAVAEQVLQAAAQVKHVGMPTWLAAAMLEGMWSPPSDLRLIAVPKETAISFVRRHHSKLPDLNTRGLMYALGIVHSGRLVAVGTAGTPTGRWKDPHRVLELTRIASDRSVKGASSMLVARVLDLLPKSVRRGAKGAPVFVTYSLGSEEGTTYRALADKGLRPVAKLRGKGKAGGARGSGHQALGHVEKIRWEAGPGAGRADWALLG